MSNRKRYIIINTRPELNGYGKPVILAGGEDRVIADVGEDHAILTREEALPLREKYGMSYDGAVFARRAVVRRALRKIRALDRGWVRENGEHLRIVEIGEFSRNVRPVMHWNIERKYRRRSSNLLSHKSKPGPWSQPDQWQRGEPLRETARAQAKRLTESFKDDPTYQFKFTAVPVYAD
ncbi:hypothetical protein [Xanthomonas phage SB4]|uniref:Uncharacterized protein n=1 Tax=Xanthomonas phage SB4 TaxID=3117473 RepID=A0ABZ2GUL2_9CAUD